MPNFFFWHHNKWGKTSGVSLRVPSSVCFSPIGDFFKFRKLHWLAGFRQAPYVKHCGLYILVGNCFWYDYLIQYWMPLCCWLGLLQVGFWVSPGIRSCVGGKLKQHCNIFFRDRKQHSLVILTSSWFCFEIMMAGNGRMFQKNEGKKNSILFSGQLV